MFNCFHELILHLDARQTIRHRATHRGPRLRRALAALSNRNMLQVVFVSLFLGTGLIQVPSKTARPLLAVFEGLSAVIIRLVDLIMLIAPLGVFSLIASTITSVAGDNLTGVVELLGALGFYSFTVIAGLAIKMGVTYVAFLKLFTPMKTRTFFAGIALVLGVDRILDMLRTTTNITGDCTVATLVAASEG